MVSVACMREARFCSFENCAYREYHLAVCLTQASLASVTLVEIRNRAP